LVFAASGFFLATARNAHPTCAQAVIYPSLAAAAYLAPDFIFTQ
jgi:hypothetical protein